MTNYLEVQKASSILEKLSSKYAEIAAIDATFEKIKSEYNIEKNLNYGLYYESEPLDLFKYLFPNDTLCAAKLRVTVRLIDLMDEKRQHFAEIFKLEAELATVKYIEDLAYEIAMPIIQKEYKQYGAECIQPSYDF